MMISILMMIRHWHKYFQDYFSSIGVGDICSPFTPSPSSKNNRELFLGKYRVKFKHLAAFSCTYFRAKLPCRGCLPKVD